ncbi:MAG: PEGA domain-containing protein [Kofleriaceae bacterium]|jgi:hypothetical protein|nr:PEGA domain-containing protein [Kofleriaceae bacterium]MBP6835858.1 PEGA domain-containing protein [Kofleriaceae bacterium]MBP9202577.1 PEGA domain-containing protein [Kofleriaceae bacterium]
MTLPAWSGPRAAAAAAIVLLLSTTVRPARAGGDDDPRRGVVVLEFRAGSSALPGIADRTADEVAGLTSLRLVTRAAARQTFGADLDGAVAACAGEATCLAGIGAKLGVADVVLVGVSELGDVILTLQRIRVADRKVASRVAESLPPGESPDRAGLGQYLGRLLPPTDFMRFGSIHVTANLRGAIVSIGGERRGTTPLAPVLVRAPATYPVRVEKAGFVPFAASIQVQPDGEVAVAAELARRGAAPPWYQRWWVVAIAGAAVAGATGATIYAVTRDDDSAPVTGTIE